MSVIYLCFSHGIVGKHILKAQKFLKRLILIGGMTFGMSGARPNGPRTFCPRPNLERRDFSPRFGIGAGALILLRNWNWSQSQIRPIFY